MRNSSPFSVPHARRWTRKLILDSGDPWELESFQAAFLKDVFAGYPECWLIIPEGNAKTTFGAGLALYHAEFKPSAMVTVAAASRDQAAWLYLAADGFVARSGLKAFRCQEGYRRIRYDRGGSRIQVFAADDRTGDGAQPTLAILDELHRHRDMRLYRTWRGKIAKRNGQIVAISTAGEPEGEFETVRASMRERATKITSRGGFVRAEGDGYVLHEYCLPKGKNPANMRDAKMANPLHAITPATLKEKFDSPAMVMSHWRRFNCGMPAGIGAAISPEQWDPLRADIGTLRKGEDVWLGIRTGQEDGAGVGIVGLRADGSAAVAIKKTSHVWTEVIPVLRRLMEVYRVRDIFIDTRQFGTGGEHFLEESGLPFTKYIQSPVALVEATATFVGLVNAGKVIHDGDEELRRQTLGAVIKESITGAYFQPGGNNAFIGLIMAVNQAILHANEKPPRIHVYRGA
jgi:phage terminase large subunit-like protein